MVCSTAYYSSYVSPGVPQVWSAYVGYGSITRRRIRESTVAARDIPVLSHRRHFKPLFITPFEVWNPHCWRRRTGKLLNCHVTAPAPIGWSHRHKTGSSRQVAGDEEEAQKYIIIQLQLIHFPSGCARTINDEAPMGDSLSEGIPTYAGRRS